jgi:Fur family zinc uptake transcriptional regulator
VVSRCLTPKGAKCPIASTEALAYSAKMTVSRDGRQRESGAGKGAEAPARADPVSAALAICRRDGIALTPGRRRILELLAREGRPLGAYDLIEKVAEETGKRPAPISIYRALDFLLENGLVHRLASRNMFLACGHSHDARAPIVFLICERCGGVVEATSESMRGALAELTEKAKFSPRAQVMEVAGRCAACSGP